MVMKKLKIIILVLFKTVFINAQLVTEQYSPISTINSNFFGNEYQISNVQFSGSLQSVGIFNGTATNIGLEHGIVLTTGTVFNNGSGPHGPNNQSAAGMDNNANGSAILTAYGGGNNTFNASIIEFDIIPSIDSIGFRYVFGSDEYPEFAPPNNTSFNDIFAFFISGPGIVGNQNIALLPNYVGVVSINSVNAITNSAFYTNNGNGNSQPQNGSPDYIQYDGFTKPLVAYITGLVVGSTYHIILGIADVQDAIYDSGIFIERCSTCTFTLSLDEEISTTRKLIGVYDMMGRETEEKSNTLLYYRYSDGTSEKVFRVE